MAVPEGFVDLVTAAYIVESQGYIPMSDLLEWRLTQNSFLDM